MEKLRIKSTVEPEKKLDYNQWCKKYGFGSQYYQHTEGSFHMKGYNFKPVKKNIWQDIMDKIISYLSFYN